MRHFLGAVAISMFLTGSANAAVTSDDPDYGAAISALVELGVSEVAQDVGEALVGLEEALKGTVVLGANTCRFYRDSQGRQWCYYRSGYYLYQGVDPRTGRPVYLYPTQNRWIRVGG